MPLTDAAIRDRLLTIARDRAPDKTLCPSEVARSLSAEAWRDLMPQVRAVGVALADAGQIVVTQKGQIVDPRTASGPIRYRLKPPEPEPERDRSSRGVSGDIEQYSL